MGTSLTEYRGHGFWTRDAAPETVLGPAPPSAGPRSYSPYVPSVLLYGLLRDLEFRARAVAGQPG
jgi:hypothetical protein